MLPVTTTPEGFDFAKFAEVPRAKKRRGNPGTKDKRYFKDCIAAFDIETSRLPNSEHSFMYIWQFAIEGFPVVLGRTWEQFGEFVAGLESHMKEDERLIVFVHNLSFEFQFLRGVHAFQNGDVFALNPRKVLKADWGDKIQFRCSMLQTNSSLSKFLKDYQAEHQKLDGDEFDYSLVRYPWDNLTDNELAYCINDVLGLVEAMRRRMESNGDNLYSLPLTSTGYVRRDAKKAMRKAPHQIARNLRPTWDLYVMFRQAFRGGNTHSNRWCTGVVINDVKSFDISSSYPTVLCTRKFPMRPFKEVVEPSFSSLREWSIYGHAWIATVAFTNIRLKNNDWGCPYIPLDKCGECHGYQYDNGRIMQADYLTMTLTDVDYHIVADEYDWDSVLVVRMYESKYGWLPESFVELVRSYYRKKTLDKAISTTVDGAITYAMDKALLNSLYGMIAQNPVKRTILFDNEKGFTFDETEPWDILEEANKKSFLPYAWACWVTAWARLALEEGLKLAHGDGARFVYCDTDSVKFTGGADFNTLNSQKIREAVERGAFADDAVGRRFYMGVYEFDGHFCEFKTYGAKKYCYTIDGEDTYGEQFPERLRGTKPKSGELIAHVTTAGVNKMNGGIELDEYRGIYSYREGFIFRKAGGTESIYNDDADFHVTVDEHDLHITSNVTIKESSYTLGITADYARLLDCPDLLYYLDNPYEVVVR